MQENKPARESGGMIIKPTVGRQVHYQLGGKTLAATVVKVWTDVTVNIAFFTENGELGRQTSVTYGDGEGQWSWPPRV